MARTVDVLSSGGEATGTVELPAHLFEADVSEYALYRAVVAYEANQRQGNASVKTRSEVRRTSKKHHRQKGTGWARRGSLRSPLVRGGGVAMGPKPRSYTTHVSKSLRRRAFCSALSDKVQCDGVKVLETLQLSVPSTKAFSGVIEACGLAGQKVLFVAAESDPVLLKSCRNIGAVKMSHVGNVSTYDVIAADAVLFTRQALEKLSERYEQGDEQAD